MDRWGLAHIYAATRRDAYFLQGYNAARDRLWQIDLWRKRGLGHLAASFGPSYVPADRAARLFLYRGDMAAEWSRYAPGAEQMYRDFASGINAYVDEVLAGRKPLPAEFRMTQSRPERWAAEDAVRIRSNTLVANALSEALRSRVACAADVTADRFRVKLSPPHRLSLPQGVDPCLVTEGVIKDYLLGTQPVSFSASQALVALDAAAGAAQLEGSNNWVVGPGRTATGRPILANDPHRALTVPSLRYVVHLEAPGLSIIGAGEPSQPNISFGHNANAAFGLTIFGIDQEDLYVYETKPGDPDAYRYGGTWERMKILREKVDVKGGGEREVELRFTRHGAVLFQDANQGFAVALRTVWNEPGSSGYAAASWLTNAKSWQDFRAAVSHWGTPPLNLVWADVGGTIGWSAAGRAPVRENWDGLVPVPGDGRYEWAGFQRPENLPSILNPERGWIGTANEMNLPAGYPADQRKLGFEWGDRSRIDRISEVLAQNASFSVGDAADLQVDSHSSISRRLVSLAKGLSSSDPDVETALGLIRAWDNDVAIDSPAAAIYELWGERYLGQALLRYAPSSARGIIKKSPLDVSLTLLEDLDPALGPEPKQARDAVLLTSLAQAVSELRATFGPDMRNWGWGRLHHASFEPAIAPLADVELRKAMNVGPAPVPGSGSTPRLTAYKGDSLAAVHGASVRIVIDVGGWDNSIFVNTPGQSGDSRSPHYADLFKAWAAGTYVPLSYSRAAVARSAERTILLKPANKMKQR